MTEHQLSATRYIKNIDLEADTAIRHEVEFLAGAKSVLEVGPATGVLTRHMLARGCVVTAIEVDSEAASLIAALGVEVHVGDIEKLDLHAVLGSRRFDAITFGDVLEHLRSPERALKRILPFLVPNGVLIISVPNIAHAAIVYELVHGRFEYRPTGLLDATHIHFFTRETLMRAVENAGFAITELRRIVCEPTGTEININMHGTVDQALIDRLLSVNPESKTYQFVLKAVPALEEMVPTLKVHKTIERIDEVTRERDAANTQIARMKSEIEWLESRWPYSWLRRFREGLKDKRPK